MTCAIIVDDELHALHSLEAQLKKIGNVNILASCVNVNEALTAINELKPDLLFLDVELSDNTGFKLLQDLPDHFFDVIFTTAYEQYALQAIKASALDYLMKPIKLEELILAINKHLEKKGSTGIAKQVEVLMQHYRQSAQVKNLALPTQDGIEFINMDDIIRLEANSNYTFFYLSGQRKLIISRTMKDYEQMLAPYGFFRIHNSHIINIRHLDKYFRGDGGYVRMKDGSTADVSRHRKEEFIKAMGKI